MDKVSVIIPTIWKSEYTMELLERYSKSDYVGEIILIDNAPMKDIVMDKIIHIKEAENTYVNPAWNKGYELAFPTIDKLCFLNDDVITDWDIFDKMDYDGMITEERGMIGPNESCWKGLNTSPGIPSVSRRDNCYGCLFFMHKNSYVPIPEDLLIHYGDDWLFTKSGKQNYGINAWPMSGESEQTSGLPIFNSIKELDRHNWVNKYK